MGGESHPAYQAHLKFDRLRYRLLPYVYSLAGAVTHEARHASCGRWSWTSASDAGPRDGRGPVPLRPGVPRQPGDRAQGAHAAASVLPAGAAWYDFWTGAMVAGGQAIDAAAPYDAMPRPRAGGLDRALRAGAPVHGREARRPGHALRLRGRRRRLHPLRGRRRSPTATRRAPSRAFPLRWNDATAHTHHRQAPGVVPGDARVRGRSRWSWSGKRSRSASPSSRSPTARCATTAPRSWSGSSEGPRVTAGPGSGSAAAAGEGLLRAAASG